MPASQPVIPRFEPEIVQAIANRDWRGDTEKVATTSLESLTVNGIVLTSRYGKASEYESMAAMASILPGYLAARVATIFFDSKSGHATVSVPAWDRDVARAIGELMQHARLAKDGHHGGIWVQHAKDAFDRNSGEDVEFEAADGDAPED